MIAIPFGVMLGALVLAGLPRPMPRWAQWVLAVLFAGGLLVGLGMLFLSPLLDEIVTGIFDWAGQNGTAVTAALMALGIVLCIGGASRAVDEVLSEDAEGPLRNPAVPAAAAVAGLLLLIVVVHERL